MDNAEKSKQKIERTTRQIAVLGGIFSLALIFLGACVNKLPRVVVISIIVALCVLFLIILRLLFIVKKERRLLKKGK